MSICARGIIFGIELIGFLIICIIMLCKHYKRDKRLKGTNFAKVMINENVWIYSIFYAIVFALFLFSYDSLPFLSYDKMLMVGIMVVFFSVIIINSYYFGTKREEKSIPISIAIVLVCLILFALKTSKLIYFGY